jgi:hypothetical protein
MQVEISDALRWLVVWVFLALMGVAPIEWFLSFFTGRGDE